jgi:hypothetical protein
MNGIRKFLTAGAITALPAAVALAIASPANATITIDGSSMSYTGPSSLDGGLTTTIGYSKAGLPKPTFTQWIEFTNTLAGIYSITLDTSSRSVDFTSAYLTNGVDTYYLTLIYSVGSLEGWGLDDTLIAAGDWTLYINGKNSKTGTLAGTISITQAVPEPGTWAMMIIGFGAVGFAMRRGRRKTQSVTQLA